MTSAVPLSAAELIGRLNPDRGEVVVAAPATGPGWWAGAPSAVADGGETVLAYRLRRPEGQGRGVAVVIARVDARGRGSTVAEIRKEPYGAESLERPWLVRVPDGWRLYLSCATPGSKHWRVVAVEAGQLDELANAPAVDIWRGDDGFAAKDPVIVRRTDGWHAWVCLHPLADPDATDRMFTRYARSEDGWRWRWAGTALEPQPGGWDARGVRISDVLQTTDAVVAFYDGRADAAENFEERTGAALATSPGGPFSRWTGVPVAESHEGGHGLRYLSVAGPYAFYEYARAGGEHDLRRLSLF